MSNTLHKVFCDVLHHEICFFLHFLEAGNFCGEVCRRIVEDLLEAFEHVIGMSGHFANRSFGFGYVELTKIDEVLRDVAKAVLIVPVRVFLRHPFLNDARDLWHKPDEHEDVDEVEGGVEDRGSKGDFTR